MKRLFEMVIIPAGEIELRDDRIKAAWKVELNSFLFAPVPVTNAYSLKEEGIGQEPEEVRIINIMRPI